MPFQGTKAVQQEEEYQEHPDDTSARQVYSPHAANTVQPVANQQRYVEESAYQRTGTEQSRRTERPAGQKVQRRKVKAGVDSWRVAYRTQLFSAAWYLVQWIANGLFTVLAIYPYVLKVTNKGLVELAKQPAWAGQAAAITLAVLAHLLITHLERKLWNDIDIEGHLIQRVWRRIVFLWKTEPKKTLLIILAIFTLDVVTSGLGIKEAYRFFTDTPLPNTTYALAGVGLLAIWIAVSSEEGVRDHWTRAKAIKKHRENYWRELYAPVLS